MSNIYLSYHRADTPAAERVESVVVNDFSRGDRITVWTERNLPFGSTLADELERRLAESNCVILLWSVDASRSRWIAEEANYALEDRKLIVGTLDETPIPSRFRDIQAINLKGWRQQVTEPGLVGLNQVIDRLQRASK